MKNFLSITHFKEHKIIFILFALIIILGSTLTRQMNINYFNGWSLVMSVLIWGFSCLIQPSKYFNLASMIVCVMFGYGVFWFITEVLFKVH